MPESILTLGDLNPHFAALTLESARREANSSASFLQVADRVFLKLFTEVDPTESASMKGIQRGAAPAPTSVLPGGTQGPQAGPP